MAKEPQPGIPDYKNNLLISIMEKYLPTGSEVWAVVAGLYKEASSENIIWDCLDLHGHYWPNKKCIEHKKPTGHVFQN